MLEPSEATGTLVGEGLDFVGPKAYQPSEMDMYKHCLTSVQLSFHLEWNDSGLSFGNCFPHGAL